MLGVIWWHVTCMLSLAGHWKDRRALSNHVCAHSVIPMWHVVCLQHLARASSEQSRSTTVLPINHVIQIPQCLSGFVNHDYWNCIQFQFRNCMQQVCLLSSWVIAIAPCGVVTKDQGEGTLFPLSRQRPNGDSKYQLITMTQTKLLSLLNK